MITDFTFTMTPKSILWLIAGLIAGGAAAGQDSRETGVLPPLNGVVVARAIDEQEQGGQGEREDWTLSVTLLREVWHTVGQVMRGEGWPEMRWEKIPGSTASLGTMTFTMNGSSGAALCRLFDLEGRKVGRDRALQDLKTGTRLLVSVSGRIPEQRYRQLPTQAELVVVLGQEPSGTSGPSRSDAAPRAVARDPEDKTAELDPATWGERESQEYFFGLMEKGKSFRLDSEADARRYVEGLWRLDRRAHIGGGHYVHSDRGDDVTVIWTDSWLVTSVFNHHSPQVAESVHRIETLSLRSDGSIVVNRNERFKPLDQDHMAMLGYDFIAVVQRRQQ